MAETGIERDGGAEDELTGRAIVGSFRSARRAHEAGLAVLASGQPYWVIPIEDRYLIAVPSEHARRLRTEILIAERNNRFWPPAPLDLSGQRASAAPTAVAALGLIVVFALQSRLGGLEELGANDAARTLGDGQWWRLLTAVTLHADIGHLAGNLLGLSLFSYLSCRYLGNGLGWLLALAAAASANLASGLLQAGDGFVSLGASTAVFAALGLLAGYPLGARARSRQPVSPSDWLAPLSGGCVLLAWMGGGAFPTDVLSHVWSFGFGLAYSAIAAAARLPERVSPAGQRTLLACAAGLVAGAWAWAWLAG
jgi:membrane associated rhomboid family serine protease